jgi:hypothetical protein
LLVRQTRESGRVSAPFYQWLFIRSHNEMLSASQDRAGIVFDCRIVNDSALGFSRFGDGRRLTTFVGKSPRNRKAAVPIFLGVA